MAGNDDKNTENMDQMLGYLRQFKTGDPLQDAERLRIAQGTLTAMAGGPGRQNSYQQGKSLTMLPLTNGQSVVELADGSQVSQWLVTVQITDPDGLLPAGNFGAGLIITSHERIDSDEVIRTLRVGVGNAVSFYAQGKSLKMFADNPFAAALSLSYKIIQGVAGIAVWQSFVQATLGVATETTVAVPTFARTMIVMTDGSAGNLVLRQYINGVVRLQETLATPRTLEIPLIPGASVTLEASAAMPITALFNCLG